MLCEKRTCFCNAVHKNFSIPKMFIGKILFIIMNPNLFDTTNQESDMNKNSKLGFKKASGGLLERNIFFFYSI